MNLQQKKDNSFLATEPLGKLLLKLSLPTVTAQIINMLYNIVDRIYIGHIPENGALALTGVGVCMPLIMIVSAFAALVGNGGAPRASIFMGKGDKESAERTLGNCFTTQIIVSLLLTIILFTGNRSFLMAFGASENTVEYGTSYMNIYSLGTIFVQLTLGMNAFITAQGFAKTGMLSVLIGAVANIILDPIFIFGLDLGISGAAIATLLSQCVSASILASFFLRGQSEIRVSIRCVSTAPKIYLTIFKSGMPSFFRQGMASVSAMALNFNAGVYGDAAVAAMAIVTKVFNFLLSAVIGFGQGMQPVVGYNYGAKELGRVRQAVSFSLKFCTVILTVAAAVGAVFAPQIVQFFRNDPAVVAVGTQAFRFQCISLPLAAVLVFANMLFQSLGKSWRASLLALCRQGMFFIPLVYLLPMHFGLLGLEVTQMCSDLIAFLVSAAFLLHYFRREFDRV